MTSVKSSMATLKNQRGGHASALTKIYNDCDALISSSGNSVSVSSQLEKARKQFDLFESSNAEVDKASNGSPSPERYFKEKLFEFRKFETRVNDYMMDSNNSQHTDEQSRTCNDNRPSAEVEHKKAILQLEMDRQHAAFRREEERRKMINQRAEEDLHAAHEQDMEDNKFYMTSLELGIPVDDSCLQRRSKVEELSQSKIKPQEVAATPRCDRRDLPKRELLTFSGDVIDYCTFMSAFKSKIERNGVSNEERLGYLIQYCSGVPKQLIRGCIMLGDSGYQRALKLLDDKYGRPHLLAQSYVNQLTTGSVIKQDDVKALESLSTQMHDAVTTLTQIGYGSLIDNPVNLQGIVARLPYKCKEKWIDKEYDILMLGRAATAEDLCEFIDYITVRATSMYSHLLKSNADTKSTPKGRTTEKSKASTFTVTTESSGTQPYSAQPKGPVDKKKCWYCDGPCRHLADCKKFVDSSMKERKTFLRKKQLCYNCFGYKHTLKNCQKDRQCTVPDCTSKHHLLMHEWWLPTEASADAAQVTTLHGECMMTVGSDPKMCLRILPVEIVSGSKRIRTYAMLDDGATQSLCTESLAKELGLRSTKKNYTLTSISGPEKIKGNQVSLKVKSVTDSTEVNIKKVWTVKELQISLKCLPSNEEMKKWPHLAGLHIPEIEATDVTLLIGGNAPSAFWNCEERRGGEDDPYARRTPLGWTILGPISTSETDCAESHVHFVQASSDDMLREQLERMWKSDFPDVDKTKMSYADLNKKTMSRDDIRAMKIIEDTTVLKNGHYTTSLPWKEDEVRLPNNKQLAEVRLSHLKKKLLSNNDHKEMYCKQMTDYLEKGFAVPVNEDSKGEESKKKWYLPHHGVVNVNKPGKVRVVFDCAARYKGMSLNDNLLQGPDLVNSLIGVLMRFRQERVALMADIEGMFNQVKVTDEDTNALRFLWWRDGDPEAEIIEYKMLVQIFGAASSPCICTYAVKRTASENKRDFSEDAVRTLDRNFYVDDLLKSVKTPDEAINLVGELSQLLDKGGFRLTKWLCNDKTVLATIPDTEKAKSVVDLALEDDLPIDRALGVRWNVEQDVFVFIIQDRSKPFTRRGILSVVASLYDPLGFVAPVTLFAKLLLQKLCRDSKGWDDEISHDDAKIWCTWLDELHHLSTLKIPRCYKPNIEDVLVQLHVFTDASEKGYGACAYLRMEDKMGQVHVAFVIGRSRLAPIKTVTLPRLELSAAVVGVRIRETIRCELEMKVSDTVFWSDSMIVIAYIRNTKSRFKTFVANRLTEIHETTTPDQWRHVRSENNPADVASRCITASDEDKLSYWLNGPAFLKERPEDWPSTESEKTEAENMEIKNEISVNVLQIAETPTPGALDELIARYSSIQTLQRVWAWLMRFKSSFLWKHSKRLQKDEQRTTGVITTDEIRSATADIVKYVQSGHFTEELACLKKNTSVPSSSKLASLNPSLLNGVMVVGGRIRRAKVYVDTKHQVILPRKHHFTTMLLRHLHEKDAHTGPVQLLSTMREKYWMPHGLQECKSIVRGCFDCKRRQQRPAKQLMADLPKERVTPDNPPFHSVGIDYFGPFMVKLNRSHLKRYGVIFTCMATRAVHFEVAHSLDADSFLGAFSRFVARRGRPDNVFSDNGTNFIAGERELREMLLSWNQEKINRSMAQNDIRWNFNPPKASHMGGAWERLIRSARNILKALVKEHVLRDESLLTFMAEAERIMNDRPITMLSDDVEDPLPLTPAMLMLLKPNKCLPAGIFCRADCYPRRWFKQAQFLADQFWKRWLKEYLPSLQTRQVWQKPIGNVKVNDVVLIVDENTPRGRWPMAIVTEVKSSDDGFVRSCTVRSGQSLYDRPIHKLCLLEQSN